MVCPNINEQLNFQVPLHFSSYQLLNVTELIKMIIYSFIEFNVAGVDLVHPVRQTFCCPEAALLVPEALTEVGVFTSLQSSTETSEKLLQELENRLQKNCGQLVIARRCHQYNSSNSLAMVELFDSEGNPIDMDTEQRCNDGSYFDNNNDVKRNEDS